MSRANKYVTRLLWLGDSIQHGFGAQTLAGSRKTIYDLAQAAGTPVFGFGPLSFPGNGNGLTVDPYHDGIDGAHVAQVNGAIFNGDVAAYKADVVLYAVGTNDIFNGSTGAQLLTAVGGSLDVLNLYLPFTWSKVIVFNVLRRLDMTNAEILNFNAGLAALLAGKSYASKLSLFDQYNLLADADYNGDGLHPLDSGYVKRANGLWPVLQAAIAAVRASTAVG